MVVLKCSPNPAASKNVPDLFISKALKISFSPFLR